MIKSNYVYFIFPILLVVYSFIFLFNFVTNNHLLMPEVAKELFSVKHKIPILFFLISGIILLVSGSSLLLWGEWGRFIGIIALILSIFIHGIQIDILIALSKAGNNFYLYYIIVAIIFIIFDLFGVYFLIQPSTQEYYSKSKPYIYSLMSLSNDNFSRKKGLRDLYILVFLMLTGGISTIILGIAYKYLFPEAFIPWMLVFALLMTFSFFSITLFLKEKMIQIIPYTIFFFILLYFYIIYRAWLFPLPHLADQTFYSLIEKELLGKLGFFILDLLNLIVCLLIVIYGIKVFIINKNIMALFDKENEKPNTSTLFF